MGRLERKHLIEVGIWLLFAALAYYFSIRFEKSIEIYAFGATGWPRAVILVIVLSALAQLYWQWKTGDDLEKEKISNVTDDDDQVRDNVYYARLFSILLLPVVYAYIMDWVGFYASTPFFIAGVILLMGERRWKWILGVTAAIWVVIVFVFTVLLYTGLPTGNISPFYDFSNWLLVILR